MLSIGKHPPDPPCACDIPPLNCSTSTHERPSPSTSASAPHHKLAFQELDLRSNPSFSIRNYVFTARSKDISTNWPFSSKNLQLCLKHGVKDPLPPLECPDNVKNRLSQGCTVEALVKQRLISNSCDEEPSRPKNDRASDNELAEQEACVEDFPSTTTSVSQYETESVPTNRQSNSVTIETKETAAAAAPASCKPETGARLSGKKCRLILKLGGHSDRSSNEDIASNSTAVSETMASKVCPVCKTFSSSSNTTLNAHIDQCLSEDSTPKWTAGTKLTRNRIKPRKTRLMVDIYMTAPQCTLEELDRRNGRNWAPVNSSCPTEEDSELPCAEEKRPQLSPVHHEEVDGGVGTVYIDSNGKKLRILSKSDDARPLAQVVESLGPKKSLKGGKGSRYLALKKKRRNVAKYLKLASQSESFLSQKTRNSQDFGGREMFRGARRGSKDMRTRSSKSQGLVAHSESGTLKRWVCSKRSGLSKKVADEGGRVQLECNPHMAQNLMIERGNLLLADNTMSRAQKLFSSSEHGKEGLRMRNSTYDLEPIGMREQSSGKRKLCSSLAGGRDSGNMGSSPPMMKTNNSHVTNPLKSNEYHISDVNNLASATDRKSLKSSQTVSTKAFSRLTKKRLSVCRSSLMRSNSNEAEKGPSRKHSKMRLAARMNEKDRDLEVNPTAGDQLLREGTASERHISSGYLLSQESGKISTFKKDGSVSLTCLQLEQQYDDPDEGKGKDGESSVDTSNLSVKLDDVESIGTEVHDDVQSGMVSVDTSANFSNYLGQENVRLYDTLDNRSHFQQSMEKHMASLGRVEGLSSPNFTSFADGEDSFSAEDIGDGTETVAANVNMDIEYEAGREYEVEPIPIPGPPGSFLPSPRALVSEEFHGNSSLTTGRVQCSQEQRDLVDGDSSDSPISTTSTISNSGTASASDMKCVEPSVSTGPPALQEKSLVGIPKGELEPSGNNALSDPQPIPFLAERKNVDGEKFRLGTGKGPWSLRNDDQPCCCQRKERNSQGIVLNFQESQLLKRRTTALLTALGTGKQMVHIDNTTRNHLEFRNEMFPQSNVESNMSRSSTATVTLKGSNDNGASFTGVADSASATPPSCNPVLRLMGKNLMVVSKDGDGLVPLGHPQSGAWNPTPCLPVSRTSGITSNSGGPLAADMKQSSDNKSLSSFGSIGKSKTKAETSMVRPGMTTFWRAPDNSAEFHGDKGNLQFPKRPHRAADLPLPSAPPSMSRPARPVAFPNAREIIIIDDTPDAEVDHTADLARHHNNVLRDRKQVVPAPPGFSFPRAISHDSQFMAPFPVNYKSLDPSFFGQLPGGDLSRRVAGASPVNGIGKWCATADGSNSFQRNPITSPPPSTAASLRSPLPFSPGFS